MALAVSDGEREVIEEGQLLFWLMSLLYFDDGLGAVSGMHVTGSSLFGDMRTADGELLVMVDFDLCCARS
jgi:hypothetical protein